MRYRLEPDDDFLHPLEEASNFNESRYNNFYDPVRRLGGWVRLGNRPNEAHAEMSTCFYLPSGQVGFMFSRPRIEGHTSLDAGGLSYEIIEPFAAHRITYDGPLLLLDDPLQLHDPRQAFKDNPQLPCTLSIDVRAIGPVHGGLPIHDDGERAIDPERSFMKGHTDQHVSSHGSLTVGEDTYPIENALGMADHSWGPRYWQAVWWYRWLTVNLGPDLGMIVTLTGSEKGNQHPSGFVYDRARYGDDRTVAIRSIDLRTDYDIHSLHRSMHVSVGTDDHVYEVEGTVLNNVPLRNQRNGQMTRIGEGLTAWSCEGHTGSGLAEYLDQVVDGRPVGTLVGA